MWHPPRLFSVIGVIGIFRQLTKGLLTLDQQAERFKRPDWNEFEPKEAIPGKRQLVD